MITRDGTILPSLNPRQGDSIHICLEGDFSRPVLPEDAVPAEQIYLFNKLLTRLAELHAIPYFRFASHDDRCPGTFFPWEKLVISAGDRYH